MVRTEPREFQRVAERWARQVPISPLSTEQVLVLNELSRRLGPQFKSEQLAEDLQGWAPLVAPKLLGCVLRHQTSDGEVAVVITEVEAYDGSNDPASHAYRGQTTRNAVMFGEAGHLYVYRSHGLHWCANVVCGPEGSASAVLLRAGRLVEGEALARQRRGVQVKERDLTRGPGRLCQALGVTGVDNGAPLLDEGVVALEPRIEVLDAGSIRSGPRVGVSKAHDVPWRFWIEGEQSVSTYRLSPRASR